MNPQAQKIEALLFVAGDSVRKAEVQKHLGEDDISSYLEEVRQHLDGSGLALIETESTVQITTAPSTSEFLAALAPAEKQELSPAAAETLAIIAYRGPIARYEVDLIRGVDSRSMIRQLVQRGAVTQIRSSKTNIRYDISESTLQNLNITKREELPNFAELSSDERLAALLEKRQSS